jgi:hypothetical protein
MPSASTHIGLRMHHALRAQLPTSDAHAHRDLVARISSRVKRELILV